MSRNSYTIDLDVYWGGLDNTPDALADKSVTRAQRCMNRKEVHFVLKLVVLAVVGVSSAGIAMAVRGLASAADEARHGLLSYSDHYVVNMLLTVMMGMVLAGCAAVFTHIEPFSAGSGIPELKTVLSGTVDKRFLSLRTLITKTVGIACAVASGLSIGTEGPNVHIAANIAYLLLRVPGFRQLGRSSYDLLGILGAAVGAGVSATFGAPIGGVMFATEVTSTSYYVKHLPQAFYCAVCGLVTFRMTHSMAALFSTNFTAHSTFSWLSVLSALVLGVCMGGMAALFVKLIQLTMALRLRHIHPGARCFLLHRYSIVVCTTAIVAAAVYPMWATRANLKEVTDELFSTQPLSKEKFPNVYFLLAFVATKMVCTVLSVTLPIPAGAYAPVFAIGAGLGRAFGELIEVALPNYHAVAHVPGVFAVVGAAAFTSGVTHTVSSIVIVLELTEQFHLVVVVSLAVFASYTVANYFGPSLYDAIIEVKNLEYLPSLDDFTLTAEQVMQHKFTALVGTEYARDELERTLRDSLDQAFPIVRDVDHMELLGAVTREKVMVVVRKARREGEDVVTIEDLQEGSHHDFDAAPMTVVPACPLYKVDQLFKTLYLPRVYVSSRGVLVGCIDKQMEIQRRRGASAAMDGPGTLEQLDIADLASPSLQAPRQLQEQHPGDVEEMTVEEVQEIQGDDIGEFTVNVAPVAHTATAVTVHTSLQRSNTASLAALRQVPAMPRSSDSPPPAAARAPTAPPLLRAQSSRRGLVERRVSVVLSRAMMDSFNDG